MSTEKEFEVNYTLKGTIKIKANNPQEAREKFLNSDYTSNEELFDGVEENIGLDANDAIKIVDILEIKDLEVQPLENWFQTDELQWVKKIDENNFTVLEVTTFELTLHKNYTLQVVDVDISALTDDELNEEIDGYYNSLEQVKESYPDDWKQIVAEIIAENTEVNLENDKSFDTEELLLKYLKVEFGIVE